MMDATRSLLIRQTIVRETPSAPPDPEVTAHYARRRFTTHYIAASHDLRGDRISDSFDWANSLIIRTAATLITTPSVSQCH